MDRSFIENEKRATMKPNLKSKFSSQNVTFNYQQFKENSIKEEGVALKCDSIKRISKIIENIHTNIGDHNKKSLREIIDQTEQDLMKSIENAKKDNASRFSRLINFPVSNNQRLTITPSPGANIAVPPSVKRDTAISISAKRKFGINKTSNFILSYEKDNKGSLSVDIEKEKINNDASKTPGIDRAANSEDLKEGSPQKSTSRNNCNSSVQNQYTKRLKYLSEIIEMPIRSRANNDGESSVETTIRGVRATLRGENRNHSNDHSRSNKNNVKQSDSTQIYPTPMSRLKRKERLKYVMKKKYANIKIKSQEPEFNCDNVAVKRRLLSPQNFLTPIDGSQHASQSSRSNKTTKMSKKEKLLEMIRCRKIKYFGRPSCIDC